MNESTTNETNAPQKPLRARVFMMGSVRLMDMAPQLAPLESMRLYSPSYPHLAVSTLSPPEVRGTEEFYRVEKPPVTTKG